MRITAGNVTATIDADYFEIQEMSKRLSVDGNSLISDDGEFYTGLVPLVASMFGADVHYEVNPAATDYPSDEDISGLVKGIELYDYQVAAARKMIAAGRGLLELPTGSGKTEIAAAITNYYTAQGKRVLFVTGSMFLTEQAADRFVSRGITDTGLFYGEKKDRGNRVMCATVQSIYSSIKTGTHGDLLDYDVIIADEVQHLPSKVWQTPVKLSNAVHRFGMSATVFDDIDSYTYRDLQLVGLTGPLIMRLPLYILVKRGILPEPIVVLVPCKSNVYSMDWDTVYRDGIMRNKDRNEKIVRIAKAIYDSSLRSITFVAQLANHGAPLLERYLSFDSRSILITGGGKVHTSDGVCKWDVRDVAKYVVENDSVQVIATPVLDEGVDIPSFNAGIMAAGMKKPRRVLQRVGRGLRSDGTEEKQQFWVFDFNNHGHPYLEAHSRKRISVYQKERIRIIPVKDCPFNIDG